MSSDTVFTIKSVDELSKIVKHIRALLTGRDVLLLNGPMGVGKTELTRALVANFEGEQISSPSFAIHNNYSTAEVSIDHLDLFRIEGEDDLESTGFWDLFNQKDGMIILEWAEKFDQELVPPAWKKIKIDLSFDGETARKISVQKI